MKIPFWEKAFKKDRSFLFGSQPNKTIVEFEHLFRKDGAVLDIGCGDGKNALYLAEQGFKNIDAFDISEAAIEKLKKLSAEKEANINAAVKQLQEFEFTQQYDLVMSFGVYHFVEKDVWKNFILKAKEHTSVGGIHIVQLFNDNIAPSPDIAPFAVGISKGRRNKRTV